jgi:hypothetical protein
MRANYGKFLKIRSHGGNPEIHKSRRKTTDSGRPCWPTQPTARHRYIRGGGQWTRARQSRAPHSDPSRTE